MDVGGCKTESRVAVGRPFITSTVKKKTDLRPLLGKLGVEMEEEHPIMLGAARILRSLAKHHTNNRL